MTDEVRNKATGLVRDMIAAGSCCAELRAVGQEWLDVCGTEKEKAATEALLAELKEDVCSIEQVYGLFTSETGAKIFGPEKAAEMAAAAKAVMERGGKTCFCPACTAGAALLEMEEALRA